MEGERLFTRLKSKLDPLWLDLLLIEPHRIHIEQCNYMHLQLAYILE